MPRKKKEIILADGKAETPKVTSLNQLFGWEIQNYTTTDENEYRLELENKNLIDLQAHATKIGLFPVKNRKVLIERLVNKFKASYAPQTRAAHEPVLKKATAEQAKKILEQYK